MTSYRNGSFINRQHGNHFLALDERDGCVVDLSGIDEPSKRTMYTYAVQVFQGKFSMFFSGEDRVYIKGWTIS